MKIFLITAFLLFLTATTVCQTQDCIQNLVDLEVSILSNNDNIQSLTKAFYPVNKHPALWVRVQYYINETVNGTLSTHPAAALYTLDLDERQKNATQESYTFYWASSPELILVDLALLEVMSLHFVSIELHTADIVISPFCDGIDDLNILNEATAWIKSYTTNRVASVIEGVDSSLQGYPVYMNSSNGDRIVLYREGLYQKNVNLLIAAIIFSIVFGQVSVGAVIWWKHDQLHNKTKPRVQDQQQHGDNQNFQFKSIFWAGVAILILVDILLFVNIGYLAAKNNSTPIVANSSNQFVYGLIIGVLVLVVTGDVIYAGIITYCNRKSPIHLPAFITDMACHNTCCKCSVLCEWIFQFLSSATLMVSTLFLSFHGCGIILAVLVNPVQVFAMGTLVFLIVIFFLFWLTYVLEIYEATRNDDRTDSAQNNETTRCERKVTDFVNYLRNCILSLASLFSFYCKCKCWITERCCKISIAFSSIFLGILFVIFLALFGLTYIEVILFAGISSTGVVSSLSQILPGILLAFIVWLVKKEYDNFINNNHKQGKTRKQGKTQEQEDTPEQ